MNKNVQTVYTFFIEDLMIDTGQRYCRPLVDEVVKIHQPKQLFITHHHEDHTGNAAYLVKKYGLDACGHSKCAEILSKGYKISPLAKLINGEVEKVKINISKDIVEFKNFNIHSIYTPGHSEDHLAYFVPERGYLFSGDLYVADKIKYFVYYEDLGLQIESIRKLLLLDFDVLFCSHNPKIINGKKHLNNKLQFFEDFYGRVVDLYKDGKKPPEILKELDMKENNFYMVVTLGNFSAVNMIHSVISHYEKNNGVKKIRD